MYNPVYIISANSNTLKETSQLAFNANIVLTYVIGKKQLQENFIEQLIGFYFNEQPVFKFTLAFTPEILTLELLNEIAILMAHPLFLRLSGGPELLQIGNEINENNTLINFLQAQGYPTAGVQIIPENWLQATKKTVLLLSEKVPVILPVQHTISDLYFNYLQSRYRFGDKLFIKTEDSVSIALAINAFQQAVADLNKVNAYAAGLIHELHACTMKKNLAETLAEKRGQELVIMKNLFEENAKNNEIAYILNFYQKEYEVLPLWYKRVGHVVKALTGKRSWRSLVDGTNR